MKTKIIVNFPFQGVIDKKKMWNEAKRRTFLVRNFLEITQEGFSMQLDFPVALEHA